MLAQSLADRRRERMVWTDRKWEWASLRIEDGDFNTTPIFLHTTAREKMQAGAGIRCLYPSRNIIFPFNYNIATFGYIRFLIGVELYVHKNIRRNEIKKQYV